MNHRLSCYLVMVILTAGIVGCQMEVPEGKSPIGALIAKIRPDSPQEKRQKLMTRLSSADADLRREGVMMLDHPQLSQSEATREILNIMARGDTDARVRAAALQTLAKIDHSDEKLPAVLKITVAEDSPLVRKESVLILAGRSDDESMSLLLDRLEQEDNPQIRAEAACALGRYRHTRVLRSLIGNVGEDEFEIAYRARQSLQKLTGEDFGYDEQAWRLWLLQTKQPFGAEPLENP